MSSSSYSFRLNRKVPAGGGHNLRCEKVFRYIDEDVIHFQGWYSTVQPSSFEKKVEVGECVCLSVVASGSRGWGGGAFKLPELCAKDLHRLKMGNRRLRIDLGLCLLWNLCVGKSYQV